MAAMIALCFANGRAANGAETVKDDKLGFTLTVPDGFKRADMLIGLVPDAVYAFLNDSSGIMLFIEKMGGTISTEPSNPRMPTDFKGRLFTIKWQQFDIRAIEIPERTEDGDLITYNAQIPLKGEAIQVKLVGPAERKSEVSKLLTETVTGLRGEPNLSRQKLRSSPLANSKHDGKVAVIVAIVLAVVGLIGLWLISRKAPRGTVLAIAACVYFGSFAARDNESPEVMTLTLAMRLLGFAGGILGLLDLVSKRKKRRSTPPPLPPPQ
jgi:hypothetical protein